MACARVICASCDILGLCAATDDDRHLATSRAAGCLRPDFESTIRRPSRRTPSPLEISDERDRRPVGGLSRPRASIDCATRKGRRHLLCASWSLELRSTWTTFPGYCARELCRAARAH